MHCVSRGGSYLVNSFCELREENQWKKESYQMYWVSLVLETRPQYNLTLSEMDSIQRQSYKQQQVAHFMVQRSPSQILSLGCSSKVMTTHQLPFCNTDRKLHRDVNTFGRKHQEPVAHERGDSGVDKKEAATLSKPIRVNFCASSLMSSPREVSQ